VRNWGTLITGFYIAVIAALSPVFSLIALNIGAAPWLEHLERAFGGDWNLTALIVWAALLAGGPLVLLLVTVDPARRKLRPRRHIWVSAAAAGLAFALLFGAAATNLITALPSATREAIGHAAGDTDGWIILAACLTVWLVWALILGRMGERLFDPQTRIHRWLIKGSVLELLVAVPSHVIVRQRNECTAPEVTSFGVATGIALLLMSLGPGALFLYRARMRRISQSPNLERIRP